MSDRMYLYEVETEESWVGSSDCAPGNIRLACEVAHWAGLTVGPGMRWQLLPGGGRIYYVSPSTLVSTVPLPWLPESSRRGVVTLGGAK